MDALFFENRRQDGPTAAASIEIAAWYVGVRFLLLYIRTPVVGKGVSKKQTTQQKKKRCGKLDSRGPGKL